MTRIGIISDTHNKLPGAVLSIFTGVKYIFHAGDIGNHSILERLSGIAPVHAVYGNTDIHNLAGILPSRINTKIENIRILMQHNIGTIASFYRRLERNENTVLPDLVIFGHTHEPIIRVHEETIFMNPGSAGSPRGTPHPTVIIFECSEGIVTHSEIIPLNEG